MVETALYITLITLHMSFLVIGTFGKSGFFISHSVRLDIGFRYHINTVLVAQIIPQIIIGIVAGTHRIQIELLHKLNILNHTLTGNNITVIRIHFVTVGSLEQDGLAVYQYLRILQFNFTETHFYGNNLATALQSST